MNEVSRQLKEELAEVAADKTSGSVQLAHRAIMALWKLRKRSKDPRARAALDTQWLGWARGARREMRVFRNLARAAASKRMRWIRGAGLPMWLITTLYNSVSRSIQRAAAMIRPRDKVLVFSYSSTLLHVLSLCAKKGITVFVSNDPHTARMGRELKAQGFRVVTITPSRLNFVRGQISRVLVSCDTYHRSGAFINQRGTGNVVRWADRQGIPIICVTTWLKESQDRLRAPHNWAFELIPPIRNLALVGDLG